MSQASIGIYAEVELRRTRLQQSIKDTEREIKTGLTKISQNVTVKLSTTIDPDLQKKLDTALSKITVKPILVPIQFVPGNMPGGAPGGMPGGAGMPGSSGGGGGLSRYINPYSMRGLARFAGGGATVYAVYEAMRMAASASAENYAFSQAGGNLDAQGRVLADNSRKIAGSSFLGSVYDFLDPRFAEGRNNVLDSLDETKMGDASANARFGSGMSAINAREAAGVAATPAGEARRRREIANRLRLAQQAATSGAASETSPIKDEYGRRRADLERQLSEADHLLPYETAKEKSIRAQIEALDKGYSTSLGGIGGRQGVQNAAAQSEADSATRDLGYDITRRGIGSSASVEGSVASSRASGYLLRGDSANALAIRQAGEISSINSDFEGRKVGKSGNELKELEQQQAAAIQAEQEKQKVETQKFNLEREKETADSIARIGAMEKSSADNILRAEGQSYNASVEALKHATAEKIQLLQNELDATVDIDKRKILSNQITAEKQAGIARQRAMALEEAGRNIREGRQANDDYQESHLEATGQHRAARDARMNNRFDQEEAEIRKRNDPDMEDQLSNLSERRRGAREINARQDAREARDLAIDTRDAEESSTGQRGVGGVMRLQAEVADMMADAKGDPRRIRAIQQYRDARAKQMLRDYRPRSQTFGLTQYADAIQSSITNGESHRDAISMLRNIGMDRNVMGLPNPDAGGGDLKEGLADWKDVAKMLKGAKTIAILED